MTPSVDEVGNPLVLRTIVAPAKLFPVALGPAVQFKVTDVADAVAVKLEGSPIGAYVITVPLVLTILIFPLVSTVIADIAGVLANRQRMVPFDDILITAPGVDT